LESSHKEQKGTMRQLSEQQKQLLFDYCLGLTSQLETAQAQELVFSDSEAAGFVASIKASLSPLDSITPEACPDELAEGTVWRAMQAVRTGRLQLNQLIAAEQHRKVGFWREMFGRLATAAVFIIVGSALITGGNLGLNYARQLSRQTQCGSQLAGLFNGLSNYKADNAGQMPALATAPGEPWWKVGYQGPENFSNTRRMWVLVKNEYAKQEDFLCPARKTNCSFSCNPKDYNDFPRRNLVTYSFRIGCPKSGSADVGRRVIIADLNPIFEVLPLPSEDKLIRNLSEALIKQNSPNHAGRGQNVLFCDGSVQFIKTRIVDVSEDDIFTLQGAQTTYQGTELPASEADAFLAP
jgi:prepilin-type processing-associated H-X9-DG protein